MAIQLDEGYTGYDCSDKLCATGDNPDTIDQIDEEQIIWCQDTVADVTKQDAEYVILTFRGEKTAQIPGNSNAATVKAKLEALTGIETVDVALIDPSSPDQMCTPSGNKFLIKFRTEHGNLPMLKLLKSQDINGFDIQLYKDGTKEQVECSDRGICDRTTGKCQCFTGYGASDNMGGPGANRNCGYREQATKRGIVTN